MKSCDHCVHWNTSGTLFTPSSIGKYIDEKILICWDCNNEDYGRDYWTEWYENKYLKNG